MQISWVRKGLRTGVLTTRYPAVPELMLAGFRGRTVLDCAGCLAHIACEECVKACPTRALIMQRDTKGRPTRLRLDLGACIGCGLCVEACPEGAIRIGPEYETAARRPEDLWTDLVYDLDTEEQDMDPSAEREADRAAEGLREQIRRLFGRSLHVRHVDAGSCNACESEIKLLTNPYYDVQRLGIFFTPSPRHADLLLVTGPITCAMEEPLRATYEAMPDPRLVVAVGACACSGGIFCSSALARSGLAGVLPVDVYIPGCPPSPLALIHGLLLALGRVRQRSAHRIRGPRTAKRELLAVPGGGEVGS